jgi:uncharacterized protein YegP (UPF0339 family)
MNDADGERLRAIFEVYRDAENEWRWRFRHWNGNILADSAEGYSSQRAAVDGLDAVRALAATARTEVEGADDGDDGGESA